MTRNFLSWLFRYCHNAFWFFISFIERFPSLSVTYTVCTSPHGEDVASNDYSLHHAI
jgi:hypothetical protein